MNEDKIKTMRTAVLTAYPKIFTDIPFASDIFHQAIGLAAEYNFTFQPSLFVGEMAIEIEARYKSLNNALQAIMLHDTLVVELGSGLSPRRCEFPDVAYFEIDYSPIADMKKKIYRALSLDNYETGLLAADITKTNEFQSVLTKHIDLDKYKLIVILSEGLFWYLKRKHIQSILNLFSHIFKDRNWVWLTADCPVREQLEAPYRNVIADSSDMSTVEPFADIDDYYSFFADNNFSVDRHRMNDFIAPQCIYSGKLFDVDIKDIVGRMNNYTDIAYIKEQPTK